MEFRFKYLERRYGVTKIAGGGLCVFNVLGSYTSGDKPEEIAQAFELPLAAVFEALAYAAEHPQEMDALREESGLAESMLKAKWNKRLGGRLEALVRGSPVS
ncbi:MAG TPA: DUF433 domain-containing protein [Chloroflexota bacterium]